MPGWSAGVDLEASIGGGVGLEQQTEHLELERQRQREEEEMKKKAAQKNKQKQKFVNQSTSCNLLRLESRVSSKQNS